MVLADTYIDRAWTQVASSSDGALRLRDLLLLFDVLETLLNRSILTEEFRNFLVEFIVECPDMEVDKGQFRDLVERLFECSIDDILDGKLVEGDEDVTRTMNLESANFNSFLRSGDNNEKEEVLKDRINTLESMLARNRDERTIYKMKDVLLNYYRKLDQITRDDQNKLKDEAAFEKVLARLKKSVDKQDVLIGELKIKVGDDTGVLNQLKYKFSNIYRFLSMIFRYAMLVMSGLFLLNVLFLIFFEDKPNGDLELVHEDYW